MNGLTEWNKKLEALKALIANYDAALELIKTYRLTEPDQLIKAGYILAVDDKIREALAANPCLDKVTELNGG